MKHTAIFVLLFIYIISLCGCNTQLTIPETESCNPDSIESKAYYKMEILHESAYLINLFSQNNEIFILRMPIGGSYELYRGDDLISSFTGIVQSSCLSDDTIYTLRVDTASRTMHVFGTGLDGRELFDHCLNMSPGNCYPMFLQVLENNYYFYDSTAKSLVVTEDEGNTVYSIPLEFSSPSVIRSADNDLCIVSDGNVYSFDKTTHQIALAFSTPFSDFYNGSNDAYLYAADAKALYAVSQTGEPEIIIDFEKSCINPGTIYKIAPEENGSFLFLCSNGIVRLRPADASEIVQKKYLTVGGTVFNSELEKMIAIFNNTSRDYVVKYVDYSQAGKLTDEQALLRLNTDIISGKSPDMLCFLQLSPYSYIRKGLLKDLGENLKSDTGISANDVVILNALSSCGGIYFMSNCFIVDTILAKEADFGHCFGWTIDEYLSLDASLPSDYQLINNMSKEVYLDEIITGYVNHTIDWSAGKCNLENPDFIRLLEAGKKIRETSSAMDNNVFGMPGSLIGNGSRKLSLEWLDTVWMFAFDEQLAGCPLSCVGWPTPDGSCGSQIILKNPVGIMSSTTDTGGCWEFIKFLITYPSVPAANQMATIPVYLPNVNAAIERSRDNDSIKVTMTERDVERFFEVIHTIDNLNLADDTVDQIVKNECASFLYGEKSAEDVANILQSKINIYLNEQA